MKLVLNYLIHVIGYVDKQNEIDELNTLLVEKSEKFQKVDTAINKYETDEEILKNEINSLNNTKIKYDKYSYKIQSLTNEIKKLKLEYDKLIHGTSNPFSELMEKTEFELETLKTQMIKYVKDIKHLEILRDACSENGVKRFIIKDIVKLLNS